VIDPALLPSGPTLILGLKVAVCAVSLLLVAALIALACGNVRLHGRINLAFFILTVAAVIAFEILLQLGADVRSHMNDFERTMLNVHLCFALPLPLVMGVMLYTGLKHERKVHVTLSVIFITLWVGTLVTGVFYLPHE
jgi:uncharacterized membrane protein YozB (DUF420 family)